MNANAIRTVNEAENRRLANAIRGLTLDAVQKAKSGHPGLPLGMADVATVLFSKFLKFDPANPKWPDRDRFVLSAGHGSMLLYSLLWLTGYPGMTLDDIKSFRRPSRILACAGYRNDDRTSRSGHCQRGGHGDRRTASECALR
jgi:transketolase